MEEKTQREYDDSAEVRRAHCQHGYNIVNYSYCYSSAVLL